MKSASEIVKEWTEVCFAQKARIARLEGENEALKNEITHLKLIISRFQLGEK